MNQLSGRVQALVLSGGGTRGLYTISLLATLENHYSNGDPDYNIADHFDIIGGTSIGGILALGLASGVNARTLKKVLDSNRKDIFPQNLWLLGSAYRFFRQLFGSKFSPKPLKKAVYSAVGDLKITDLHTRVLIPALNGSTGAPKTFKTPHHPKFTRDGERKVIDVALATSAAPTYFPPHKMEDGLMLDGGLWANLPAFSIYHELCNNRFLNVDPQKVHMLAVGTMGTDVAIQAKSSGSSGYIGSWGLGKKLTAMMMDTTERWQTFMTQHNLGDRFVQLDDRGVHNIELDDSNDKSAEYMQFQAANNAQYALGNQNVRAFFEHQRQKVTFYTARGDEYEAGCKSSTK